VPPKISVVIFSYNFEKYIRECIDSLLAQTLPPLEIVICDDASTDNSWKLIDQFRRRNPKLIRAFRHKKNVGSLNNGSFGGKVFKGDLVCFLDGDDRWLSRKLELEWLALERNPEAQIAYSNVQVIDAQGNRTGRWNDGNAGLPVGDVFVEVFSRRFFPNTRSVFRNELVRRFAFDKEGHCDESLESYWDWDRKIRYAARFQVAYSGEALVEYRIHGHGFHAQDPQKHFSAMVKVYEKNAALLRRRSKREIAVIRCDVEAILALDQRRFPASERLPHYGAGKVYGRSVALLRELSRLDRVAVAKDLQAVFQRLLHGAAREEIERGNKGVALKHWLESLRHPPRRVDPALFAGMLLPRWAYERLKAVARKLHASGFQKSGRR